MKGSINSSQPNCRTEIFSQNAITIFANDQVFAEGHPNSLHFARQIAAVKNVQSFCEPFYVMDMMKVSQMIDRWCESLPRVQPFYSVNCNNDAVLLKLLANDGHFGFCCQNNQNLNDALLHVPADKILYSNPVLTRASLKHAAEKDVQLLIFESYSDLDRILLHHPNAELMLQVCVNGESEDPAASMGCDIEMAPELLQLAASSGANVVGISFNLGSGCTRPSLYASAIEISSGLFDLGCSLGLQMHILNIGCGFSCLDQTFSEICAYINDSLNYYFPIGRFPRLRIMATPGRFFAGSVFSLATNIIGRRSVDLSHITNDDFDAGREAFIYQTNEGYYGGFGCRINANIVPECAPLFDHYLDNFSAEHTYGSVIGPTLDDVDVVQSVCRFRPLETGDWLMWDNMGAYSMNNRGSLDDDESRGPIIFYFTSQSQWDRIDVSKPCMNSSVPTTPIGSDYGSVDDDAGSFTMDCLSERAYDEDFLVDEQDENYEENFLATFGWPLHE